MAMRFATIIINVYPHKIMRYLYSITLVIFILGFTFLCVGQETESLNLILPVDLKPGFPSSGYPFTKTIESRQKNYNKEAEEKKLLPSDGKFEFYSTRYLQGFYSFLIAMG